MISCSFFMSVFHTKTSCEAVGVKELVLVPLAAFYGHFEHSDGRGGAEFPGAHGVKRKIGGDPDCTTVALPQAPLSLQQRRACASLVLSWGLTLWAHFGSVGFSKLPFLLRSLLL